MCGPGPLIYQLSLTADLTPCILNSIFQSFGRRSAIFLITMKQVASKKSTRTTYSLLFDALVRDEFWEVIKSLMQKHSMMSDTPISLDKYRIPLFSLAIIAQRNQCPTSKVIAHFLDIKNSERVDSKHVSTLSTGLVAICQPISFKNSLSAGRKHLQTQVLRTIVIQSSQHPTKQD